MKISSAIGGLAGACALTLLNQGASKFSKNVPRLDLLGMNVASKVMKGVTGGSMPASKLFPATLAGDLLSNTLYFGMARSDSPRVTLFRGALLGLGAGLSAVNFPHAFGVNGDHTNRTVGTKAMTVAWYVIGGLAAAATINWIEKKYKGRMTKYE